MPQASQAPAAVTDTLPAGVCTPAAAAALLSYAVAVVHGAQGTRCKDFRETSAMAALPVLQLECWR